jgi:hypothetical protein
VSVPSFSLAYKISGYAWQKFALFSQVAVPFSLPVIDASENERENTQKTPVG